MPAVTRHTYIRCQCNHTTCWKMVSYLPSFRLSKRMLPFLNDHMGCLTLSLNKEISKAVSVPQRFLAYLHQESTKPLRSVQRSDSFIQMQASPKQRLSIVQSNLTLSLFPHCRPKVVGALRVQGCWPRGWAGRLGLEPADLGTGAGLEPAFLPLSLWENLMTLFLARILELFSLTD